MEILFPAFWLLIHSRGKRFSLSFRRCRTNGEIVLRMEGCFMRQRQQQVLRLREPESNQVCVQQTVLLKKYLLKMEILSFNVIGNLEPRGDLRNCIDRPSCGNAEKRTYG